MPPWYSVCGWLFVINTGDTDYGNTVNEYSQDRNNVFGGIHEGAYYGIYCSNLSNYSLLQNFINTFIQVELNAQIVVGVNPTSQTYPANIGILDMHGGMWGGSSNTMPITSGGTGVGRITFSGKPAFNGAGLLPLSPNGESLWIATTPVYVT